MASYFIIFSEKRWKSGTISGPRIKPNFINIIQRVLPKNNWGRPQNVFYRSGMYLELETFMTAVSNDINNFSYLNPMSDTTDVASILE